MKNLLSQSRVFVAVSLLACGLITAAPAQEGRNAAYTPVATEQLRPVLATNGMVVAQERRSAEIGRDILARGGNAVDAAVAAGFAMAVTYPRAGNIGGGGFMVIHNAERNEAITIDYRETAPAAATRDMFLGSDGKPDPAKSRSSVLGVGVPGTVAGLALAHEKYGSGKFTLAELMAPAVKLAREGFPVEDDTADSLPSAQKMFARWPASAKIFLKGDGASLGAGDTLVQADLAATLDAIAAKGPVGFYEGATAQKLVDAMRADGGIMTLDDLKEYRPVIRTPVRGTYRGYDIVSMPLPSSGGVVLVEMLNILEGFKLKEMGPHSADTLHVMIEAMKRAYADRARHLGDPATADVPMQRLTSKDYATRLRESIDMQRATKAVDIADLSPPKREGQNTTHYSVVDRFGNAVSNTYTLNFSYGLGMVAEGTGVILNNELDDFTAAVGASNAYGLVGFEANLPGPGKRPLSSMSPTIVLKDGKPILVTGTPGGSRIITGVLQVILNTVDHGMNAAAAVAAPRLHNQWLPDEVRVENGFPSEVLDALRARGHTVMTPLSQTSANSIGITAEGFGGAPDPRTRGAFAAGY
jgi:gamma-glutamyltranspeptidase / glutathione hydrolase